MQRGEQGEKFFNFLSCDIYIFDNGEVSGSTYALPTSYDIQSKLIEHWLKNEKGK